jgi:MFS transporter, putative metabolite:H+ symporter
MPSMSGRSAPVAAAGRSRRGRRGSFFRSPLVFWLGVLACAAGVALHLPMYLMAKDMGYRLAGMEPDGPMLLGMALIGVGLVLSLYGLMPVNSRAIRARAASIRVAAMDDTKVRWQHIALLIVMTLAVTIDVMKPTTLSFVAPGVAKEYGLATATNHNGAMSVTWLPLFGITGTMLGSFLWGWIGDRVGRRASILYAGILFISTAICGAMPGFLWNLLMCLLMGIGAGGMLPITFVLIAEIIPARHRGWLVLLIGGDIAGAYALTSWLAGSLMPEYSWRIMWLIGLPTGLLLILLNRWIPESPRFLLAAGRTKDAEAVMRRYGAAVVQETASDALVAGPSTKSMFRGPLRGPTIAVAGMAIAAGLLTYGFQFWVPSNLQSLGIGEVNADFILRNSALVGLPLTLLISLLYGFWNSRKTMVGLSIVTALSVMVFAVFGDSLTHHEVLLFAVLVLPLAGISSLVAAVVAYAAELYPTHMRSKGAGLIAGLTKAGGVLVLALVLASFTTPSLAVTALMGAVPLVAAVVVFTRTAPDTHQRSLEDVSVALEP